MILFSFLAAFLVLLSKEPVSSQSSVNVTLISASKTSVSIPSSSVVTGKVSSQKGGYNEEEIEYPGYDGWYNNRAHPEWGVVDSPLTRRIPSAYEDGVYSPSGADRPNPFVVSDKIMNGSTGSSSRFNRTALLVFFGQQVVEEILDAQRPGCPPEYFNIKIPKGHEKFDEEGTGDKVMPFLRSRYSMKTGTSPNNPRQQLNEITPFIDGGLMYGTAKAWADALRSFKDGKLAKSKHGNWPEENEIGLPMANPPPPAEHTLKEAKRFFKLGNPRGNENPFLLTFGILWFRWHNVMAERIKQKHSSWNDEKIFNEARKWVIATHQQIVLYEWLPALLNLNEADLKYEGYKPAVHPGVTHVFQSAAMRFGHTMVPPGVYRRNANCEFRKTTLKSSAAPNSAHNFGVRTCNSFWNPQLPIRESDIEEFLMGMATQVAEREDNIITPDLRGNVFGPLEFSRRDLMAINIQRARDHGLPDYNTARVSYGLDRRESFADINRELYDSSDPVERIGFREIIQKLNDTYKGDIDSVDVWPGGLLESNSKNSPGELFHTIIKDQFLRIRDGDRFWFENYKENGLFSEDEVNYIKKITIWDIIVNCTDIPPDAIQKSPFHIDESPCLGNMTVPLTPRAEDMEECTKLEMFDYFSGSEVSYALTFFFSFLFLVGTVVLLFVLSKRKEKESAEKRKLLRKKTRSTKKIESNVYLVTEWQGVRQPDRSVKVKLGPKNLIFVQSERGQNFRTIELKQMKWILLFSSSDRGRSTLILRMEREYDLILKFDSEEMKVAFVSGLQTFLKQPEINIQCKESEMKESDMLRTAVTKMHRQKLLERFFRVAFAHAFDIQHEEDNGEYEFDITMDKVNEVLTCELSKSEFADALSLKPNSLFVNQMFELVDKDKNGFLSFREFLDVIVIFAKGGTEEKLRLFFDMYDVDGSGNLTREEFKKMIKSFMDLVSADVESSQLDQLVNSMFSEAGFENKSHLTFDDFSQVMGDHKEELEGAQLNLAGTGVDIPKSTTLTAQKQNVPKKTVIRRENAPTRARKTVIRAYRAQEEEAVVPEKTIKKKSPSGKSINIKTKKSIYTNNQYVQKWIAFRRYVENHRLQIFYLNVYLLVLLGIFAERSYFYSVEREHAGLRRIAGYGVTVTRGAASAMMFTYSLLLITMCRNIITFLRSTALHQWIPFDSAIAFHKVIAFSALVFTVMHCIGHAINFYHIATQTANDLTCLFRDYFHASHELPKFHYWCWQTITGLTGVFLLLIVIVMFVFATQYARRHVFGAFWLTHSMYIFLYILMVLHGSGNLVQPPYFQYFFIGPGVLFTLDKLVSLSRKKAEISVVKAELLPSDVTHLEFKRPTNFEYMSGQWVRIACTKLAGSEYHPFTLTSSPHEDTLSLHIRAVGPWTINLRQTYDPSVIRDSPYPKLYLDGPFGEGHQDWYRFEVAVLVGGGIGVTPFASILKDIVHKASINATFNCKKVYFLWVTRTQKHFEWLTDIIREVEDKDKKDLVTVHIFVTQFYQKFDLRTTMLYICERHFQKISGRSLFTGLCSITHFGRPEFNSFLSSLEEEHPEVSKIGVFSCGPPTMTRNVEKACADLNKSQGAAFIHHFENF